MKTAMNATIKTTTKACRTILPFFLLALPGCFSLSHGASSQRHYVLGADARAERQALVEQTAAEPAVIGLRPPRLAEYLASPFIVVRRGTHRIGFSELERWGEELTRGINRTLAGHMVARSPAHRVESAPWPPGARPDYLIQLHVLRFEGVAPEDPLDPVGEAHLRATWEILRSRDGAMLVSGTTEARPDGWTVGDFDGLVGLLDAGLGTLADDLVLGLERIHASSDAHEACARRQIQSTEDPMNRIALSVLLVPVPVACGSDAESREDLESQAVIHAAPARPAAASQPAWEPPAKPVRAIPAGALLTAGPRREGP